MIKKTCEVICIKNFHNEECFFCKGEKYKAKYDTTAHPTYLNVKIYEDENNYISFNIESQFNKEDVTKHFISLQKLRKQKLQKINENNG